MSTKAPGRDYEIGYGRTPKHTRFKPDQSGNLKGRPKGALGVRQLARRWLRKKVKVQLPDGRSVMMTNAELVIARQGQDAKKGDQKAAQWLFELGDVPEAKAARDNPAEDADLIAKFKADLLPPPRKNRRKANGK